MSVKVAVTELEYRKGEVVFSNTMVKCRSAGYRFLKVAWQDTGLSEADLRRVCERDEGFLVRLPKIPHNVSNLVLRLRVGDRGVSLNS